MTEALCGHEWSRGACSQEAAADGSHKCQEQAGEKHANWRHRCPCGVTVALGWAPPEATEDDPVLAKVVEALGRYAPSEVKWSRVLEEVRELAGRMEGLDK